MRRIALMALLAAAPLSSGFISGEAKAWGHRPYPWCAIYGMGPGGESTDCGFNTFAQCLATISGVGGICQPNTMYPGPGVRRPYKRRHR